MSSVVVVSFSLITGTIRHSSSLLERATGVQIVRAGADVEEREQHLRGLDAALAQQLVVGPVQPPLPDRARRLQVLNRRRPRAHLEQVHPARDRAARDDHDVDALAVQRRHLLADPRDDGEA